jgi:hypothetical protein
MKKDEGKVKNQHSRAGHNVRWKKRETTVLEVIGV